MSLTELIVAIGISSIVLAMVFAVVGSFARNDARNLVRQARVEEVRQVGLWLGDALAYAESEPLSGSAGSEPVFEEATAQKMVFTSDLGGGTSANQRALSRVTVALGVTCDGAADPGVLRRCVQHPFDDAYGVPQFCPTMASCGAGLFEDKVMARDVAPQTLFTYFLEGATGVGQGVPEVIDPAQRARISAVEFTVTVSGPESGTTTESTVYKRYTVNEWRRW
ncbi:MAG: hypothetical protein LBE08_06855 [Bifidobacteriaceae bacterium]|jgi:type II secretory pathway pseudopilin PulG|nr:hypothetical protein [Bifidobacteriaceae bacterium]